MNPSSFRVPPPALTRRLSSWCCRQGNEYLTTIHVLNSAIVKLGALTVAGKVYRAMYDVGLSKAALMKDSYGVSGGVDGAFQSWSRDFQTMAQYAAGGKTGAGLVYECQMDLINRGAEFAWLSQYPHEAEVTFNPLCAMEITGTRVEGSLLVAAVRVFINQVGTPAATPSQAHRKPIATDPPQAHRKPAATDPPHSHRKPSATDPPHSHRKPTATDPQHSHGEPSASRPHSGCAPLAQSGGPLH